MEIKMFLRCTYVSHVESLNSELLPIYRKVDCHQPTDMWLSTLIEVRPRSVVNIVLLKKLQRAVVVAQLMERLLLIPEVCGSNPVIGKNLFILNICLLSTVY